MDSSLIGFVIIIASIVFARNTNGKAMRLLTPEQQILFQESFKKRRWLNLAVIIGQLIGYFLLLKFSGLPPSTVLAIFFSIILLWIGIQSHLAYNEMHRIEMPTKVIQFYLLSSVIRVVGIVAYVILMFPE